MNQHKHCGCSFTEPKCDHGKKLFRWMKKAQQNVPTTSQQARTLPENGKIAMSRFNDLVHMYARHYKGEDEELCAICNEPWNPRHRCDELSMLYD